MYKDVNLMKDNFAKRYFGSTKCCLSSKWRYSAIDCPIAKFIWHTIHVSLDISPPLFFQHMFSDWLGKPKLYWIILIWQWRNEIVFSEGASFQRDLLVELIWVLSTKGGGLFRLKTALRAAYLNREYASNVLRFTNRILYNPSRLLRVSNNNWTKLCFLNPMEF